MEKKKTSRAAYMQYLSLGVQLMSGVGLSIWLGYWLDKRIALSIPVFVWVLPLVVLIFMLVKLVKDISKKKN